MSFLPRPILVAVAVAVAVGLALAPASRADEPRPVDAGKAYKVLLRERWKAGDVATRNVKESFVTSTEIKEGTADARQLPTAQKLTSYVAVLNCLEADADGYATKFIVYLTAWTVEFGDDKDSSLAGVHIEVTGKGAERAWKILTPDVKLTDVAKGFVELNFGRISSGDATNADLEPTAPVAIGDAWAGNAVAIAKRAALRGLPVIAEKAKATGTLLAVDAGQIHARVVMSLPQSDIVLTNGQRIPWSEGGVMELAIDLARPLEPGAFDAKLRYVQKTAGVAEAKNARITRDDELTRDIEITTGGKMPPVPAVPEGGEKRDGDPKAPAMGDPPK